MGLAVLTAGLLSGALIFGTLNDIRLFECGFQVSKLSMERIGPNQFAGYVDEPLENSPKIYIKGDENVAIFSLESEASSLCASESLDSNLKVGETLSEPSKGLVKYDSEVKSTSAKSSETQVEQEALGARERTCVSKFKPLKERTKTLNDIRELDSTNNKEQAEPYIDRYQQRREQIRKERLERIRNTPINDK